MKNFLFKKIYKNKRGMSLVEVVVGSTIILVAFLALLTTYNLYLKSTFNNSRIIQASLIAEEGIEATRLMRSSNWTSNIANLSNGVSYYFSWDGSKWVSSTLNVYVDNSFERKFVLSPVYRDSNDKIASSGTLDASTKLVTVTVSWRDSGGATSTRSLSTYLTNIFGN
jgi:Tfp pilus assembly protein PilV